MINRYTADKRARSDDAYTPGDKAGRRPDRAVIVYTQRCKEAFPDVPTVLGSIEASLRRIAHYDYWDDAVRSSILIDSQADILLYGNAERAIAELAHRLSQNEAIANIKDIRGTAFIRDTLPDAWTLIDSTRIDRPGKIDPHNNPYQSDEELAAATGGKCQVNNTNDSDDGSQVVTLSFLPKHSKTDRAKTVIRLPSYKKVKSDPVLYAHASRVLHLETNPGNARALVQNHDGKDVWLNPPPIPLSTEEDRKSVV